MLPFTHDQFLAVFAAYNRAVWPMQLVAYAAGAAVCLAIARRKAVAGRVAAAVLAALWTWTGVAYHAVFFSAVNPAAVAFAGIFVVQGALFAFAAYGHDITFEPADRRLPVAVGWTFIAYAALLYPAIGWLAGLRLPAAPVFGITPCPLTIFSLGVLLLARSVPWWLFVVPIAWSVIGSFAAWQLAIPQDWALLLAAATAIAMARATPHRRATAR